jgi:hypothetical protein
VINFALKLLFFLRKESLVFIELIGLIPELPQYGGKEIIFAASRN